MPKQLSDAFKNSHGQLHRELGVAAGKPIPRSKLKAAIEEGGKAGKRALPVLNMERAKSGYGR